MTHIAICIGTPSARALRPVEFPATSRMIGSLVVHRRYVDGAFSRTEWQVSHLITGLSIRRLFQPYFDKHPRPTKTELCEFVRSYYERTRAIWREIDKDSQWGKVSPGVTHARFILLQDALVASLLP